jgi:hypothetical protein
MSRLSFEYCVSDEAVQLLVERYGGWPNIPRRHGTSTTGASGHCASA